MKQTQTFIVFRDKKKGYFLSAYKNNGDVLAFTASYTKEIKSALSIPEENFKEDKEKYEGMLQAFGAEPLIVEAEYTLTTLDGKKPEEIKMTTFNDPTDLTAALRNLVEIFAGGDD